MHPALTKIDHRPWPLPPGCWSWRQSWHDLLFIHFPVKASFLRPLVPPELTIQEFNSDAWIGIVPFRMEGVMRRPFPNLPWISAFPELNVRTYVEYKGKPGVWFFSLDAANPLAVWAARRFFYLPYYRADMSVRNMEGTIRYTSVRRKGTANFNAEYRPVSESYTAASGTLEHWLIERYCLYAYSKKGGLFCADVHHHPWKLQKAEASINENTMLHDYNLDFSGHKPLLHFSRAIDVVIWPLTLIR